ncbi:uncharacterized protein LOC129202519 isoform X3 [Grus americana]|uniref:uncharacterized protein LOC129202519 isoform X3 n=1 Tax=Grus americana TaxID=9117 RepID=UPI00240872D1|nr:uncharacterized protein LOC129202519 isoform X3 [Grus americana]
MPQKNQPQFVSSTPYLHFWYRTRLDWVHTNAVIRELCPSLNKHTKTPSALKSLICRHPGLLGHRYPPGYLLPGELPAALQPEKGSLGRCVAPSPPLPQSAPPRVAVELGRRVGERCPRTLPVFSMAVDWLGFGYAALVASGGLIGYAKAGSVPSLAAGLFFGSLAGLGAYQLSQNPNNVWISLILNCSVSLTRVHLC